MIDWLVVKINESAAEKKFEQRCRIKLAIFLFLFLEPPRWTLLAYHTSWSILFCAGPANIPSAILSSRCSIGRWRLSWTPWRPPIGPCIHSLRRTPKTLTISWTCTWTPVSFPIWENRISIRFCSLACLNVEQWLGMTFELMTEWNNQRMRDCMSRA